MDWTKIERQAKIHTNNLAGGNRRSKFSSYSSGAIAVDLVSGNDTTRDSSFLPSSQDGYERGGGFSSSSHYLAIPPPPSSGTSTSYLTQEILDLKHLLTAQNEKINHLSQELEHTSLLHQKYDSLSSRCQQLENEQQKNFKYLTNLSKEQSEYLLQSTNIVNKMEWLEELICSTSQDYLSKATFTQFLETCSEQLKGIHITTEAAKNNTSLCMSFLDSFLVALSQLQHSGSPGGGNGGFIMGLEYLTSLGSSSSGGREKQSAQITNILRSALSTTIMREVDTCTANLQKLTVTTAEDMRKELSQAMEEIKEEVLRHGQGIGDEVMKASENTAHSIAELSKQIDRVKRKFDGESAAQRESQQVIELEIAVTLSSVSRIYLLQELRQALKRTDDACTKLSTITIPASQRNHKALLDEVLRMEESNSQLLNRMEISEKSLKKFESQISHLQSSQAEVLKSFEDEGRQRENFKKIEKERQEEWDNERSELRRLREKIESLDLHALRPEISQPLQVCAECVNLKNQLSNLEEKTNKLSSAFKTLDEGMNTLQTEFASMYEEFEKKIDSKQQPQLQQHQPQFNINEVLSRFTSTEKEINSVQTGLTDQIKEIRTKMTNEKIEFEEKYRHLTETLQKEMVTVRRYVDDQVTRLQRDLRRESDVDKSLPEIITKVDRDALEEAKKLQEEIENEIAESESKIKRRNQMLQEEEDDDDQDGEGGRVDEESDNDDEPEVEEPEESSFLESDEEEKTTSLTNNTALPSSVQPKPLPSNQDDEDDEELSVNSSQSSHSHHSMKETSRIEDSLDESIEVLESMKHQQKSTPIISSTLMFEVDSLGNMVPIKRSPEDMKSATTISSGSLLGSGGRNKSAPLPSTTSLPSRSTSLPPPPASLPLPNPSSTRHHQEDTAQCTFCLRRFNIEELKSHLKICELRTELCKYGCRSRIMASKMEKHLEICPNNPSNRE